VRLPIIGIKYFFYGLEYNRKMFGNVVQNVGKSGINGAVAAGLTYAAYGRTTITFDAVNETLPLYLVAGLSAGASEFLKTQVSILSSQYLPASVDGMVQGALPVMASVAPVAILAPKVMWMNPTTPLWLGGIAYASDLIADEILKRLPASVVGEVRVDGTQAV